MNAKVINEIPKTLAIVFETGDEVMAGLKKTAAEYKLSASQFTAIGAFEMMVVGFFDVREKKYRTITLDQQMEVLSLMGGISLKDATAQIHAHVVVGLPDASTRGGHLIEGHVRPTLEVVLTEAPAHLHRKFNADAGLSLIDLEEAP